MRDGRVGCTRLRVAARTITLDQRLVSGLNRPSVNAVMVSEVTWGRAGLTGEASSQATFSSNLRSIFGAPVSKT